jgi:starch synthase
MSGPSVLIAAAELSPLARTGGLGEAIAGLSRALASLGVHVTVALPRYQHLESIGTRKTTEAGSVWETSGNGYRVWLVDIPEAFARPGIYGPEPGTGYDDQWLRFGLYSVFVRTIASGFDVLHLNDSHTAAAAPSSPVPSVLTIHNAAYSIYGPLQESGALLGLASEDLVLGGTIEWFGQAHYLKAGVNRAHRVTTVSPSFALQLTEDATVSNGLDAVLRARSDAVVGILNGIDVASWDPRTDPVLPTRFSPGRLAGRSAARDALHDLSGLDPDGFWVGNVGRMTDQKGIGLLDEHLDDLVTEGIRLVLVGNGDLDPMVDRWMDRHPTAVWHSPYTEDLARLTSAGTDAYLMPSRYEPCGLGQMYAMRYGSVPIVRLTGGLADTVFDLDEHPTTATGFGFRSFESASLAKTMRRAMRIHRKSRAEWRMLQRNGMGADFSWERSAQRYIDVYHSIL